jgi:transcription antitermination protein NusB
MAKPTQQQLQIAKRQRARHYAVQALYQWRMAQAPLNQIEAEFRVDNDFDKVDGEYFHELLHRIPALIGELDAVIEPNLTDRAIDEVNPVELALLRMSTYELKERIDVPYKVVINEAVSLAKKFGATESHKFINAVLDKVVEQFRAIELQAAGR